MSDTAIFAVGILSFLLLAGGLAFTIYQVPRLYPKEDEKL